MLSTLIVDDEAPARSRLRKLHEPMVSSGRLQIYGEASDGAQALEILRSEAIDLIFLDINMPEMDGFDVLQRIEPSARPAVVFTTAFDQFALRAFETNAVDYLLKPVSRDRLEEAVRRSERERRSPEGRHAGDDRLKRLLDWLDERSTDGGPVAGAVAGGHLRQISIPYRDRILIVPIDRLVAAEIDEGITRLHVLEDERAPGSVRLRAYVVHYTLDQLESSLDPHTFMRVHRSSIVQIDKIREMIPWFSGRYKLLLEGGHEVVASRDRSKNLKERLML